MHAYCIISISNQIPISNQPRWDHKMVIERLNEIFPHFTFVGSQQTNSIYGWGNHLQKPQLIKDIQKQFYESRLVFNDRIDLHACNGLNFCHAFQQQLKLLNFAKGPTCFTEFLVERIFSGCQQTQDCQCSYCYVVI